MTSCTPPDKKLKVLITGGKGQLASDLRQELNAFEVLSLGHSELDVTDMDAVNKVMDACRPDIVINTAAYVRVDDCESHPDQAFHVNALGARNVAVAAQRFQAKLVHISTDYVFGGEPVARNTPYTEFETPSPVNAYGKSKLAGEALGQALSFRHFIVRTSGLFGVDGSSGKGGNFIQTVLDLARESQEIRMVTDQVFSPSYSRDVARKIAQLVGTEYFGVFHVTNSGTSSWYDFAGEILKLAGAKTRLIAITSEEYPTPARRPRFSVLNNYHLRLLGMDDMKPWQEALRDYMLAKGQLAATTLGKESGNVT